MLGGVSRNLSRGFFLRPPDETSDEIEKHELTEKSKSKSKSESQLIGAYPSASIESKARHRTKFDITIDDFQSPKSSRRRATLYDAVAGMARLSSFVVTIAKSYSSGRVSSHGFHPSEPFASKYRDTASSGARDLRPEEALFRSKTLLKRLAESEAYFAHERLPADCPLPSTEILEAVHAYTADYYHHLALKNGRYDHYTMDETALLAVGILVEEMARDSLGQCGDLVLLEGQLSDEEEVAMSDTTTGSRGRKRRRSTVVNHPITQHEHLRGVRQKFKRRRLRHSHTKANRQLTADREEAEADEHAKTPET